MSRLSVTAMTLVLLASASAAAQTDPNGAPSPWFTQGANVLSGPQAAPASATPPAPPPAPTAQVAAAAQDAGAVVPNANGAIRNDVPEPSASAQAQGNAAAMRPVQVAPSATVIVTLNPPESRTAAPSRALADASVEALPPRTAMQALPPAPMATAPAAPAPPATPTSTTTLTSADFGSKTEEDTPFLKPPSVWDSTWMRALLVLGLAALVLATAALAARPMKPRTPDGR